MNTHFMKRVGGALLMISVGITGTLLGIRLWGNVVSAQEKAYEGFDVFTEVFSLVQKNHVEPVQNKKLIQGALHGLISTLDAHSSYMPPEIYKESQIDTKGKFGGIGLQVGMKENRIVVIAPIAGTPADRVGILAGDIILKVDDQELTQKVSLLEAVHKMRGPNGTSVTLTLQRKGVDKPLVFTLVRETIHIQSVKSEIVDKGIGHIRVIQFQEETARDLATALAKLKASQVDSLILDLRNNPGGLLTAAVEVAEQFLEKDKQIVSVKTRDGKKDDFTGRGGKDWKDAPLVVLVNHGSASASEIVSGAFQDWGRAVIVGAQTFGKGSVQTIFPLSDGSALRLTTAKYYTPKGRSIQDEGVRPDIVINTDEATQTGKITGPAQKDSEKKEPSLQEKSEGAQQNELAETTQEKKDIQLQKAIDLLKSYKIFKSIETTSLTTLSEAKGKVQVESGNLQ